MITAVDTNIFLDLLIPNAHFVDASKAKLEKAHDEGGLIICEVVWAELASQFAEQTAIEAFLRDTGIRRVPATEDALFTAGLAWKTYRKRREDGWRCAACSRVQREVQCDQCGARLRGRQHIVSDFLIGAHALHQADRLLSRDRGFYATYFGELTLIV